jgi:N-acylneuraminate cytidylyltransferase
VSHAGSPGDIIATVCARGGSKGLPGKNLRPFAGEPLIAHTIRQALACALIREVFVSTDDEQIAETARDCGAQVPYRRPADLATDDAPKLPVIEHLVRHIEDGGRSIELIVDLQPTSPLRTITDLERAIGESGRGELVVSVTEPSHNPYFSLAELQSDGTLRPSIANNNASRQQAPVVYGLNGSIYVWRRAALTHAARHGFWSVAMVPYVMPRSRSVDIDVLEDFELAEWYHSRLRDSAG